MSFVTFSTTIYDSTLTVQDPFVREKIVNGDEEQRKKYMVPQSVANKLLGKKPEEKKCTNNQPPTNYYFNAFVKHVQTDDIDFSTL